MTASTLTVAALTLAALLGVAWWPARLALRWWRERRERRKVRRWAGTMTNGEPLTLEVLDRAIKVCERTEEDEELERLGNEILRRWHDSLR